MANFNNTILSGAIWEASREFAGLESRTQGYGAIQLMLANQKRFPEIGRLASAGQRPASIQLDSFTPTTAGTSISCSPVSANGDSVNTALTWQTISNVVTISEARATENLKTTQEQAKIDYENALAGMHDKLETEILSFINTNRSGYSIAKTGLSTWVSAGSANYNSIALARKDHIRSTIKSEMRAAKYRGNMNLLISSPYDEYLYHTGIQGTNNSENMQDQLSGFNTFITDNASTVSSTYGGIYAVPVGGVMMFIYVEPRYLKGSTNSKGVWSSTPDPKFGFNLGMFTKEDCADTTARGGGPQDNVSVTEFHFQVAFATPTLTSPSLETVIHKYALATT